MRENGEPVTGLGVAAEPQAPSETSAGRVADVARRLETRSGERHIVALQDFSDPDAISCGMAYREIARRFDIDADLVYDGQISHAENRALVNLLEIPIREYEPAMDLSGYAAAVFVD